MDMGVTRSFYHDTLGFPIALESPELLIVKAGSVFVAFKQAVPRDKHYATFSPFEVGLDHVALVCETEEELHRLVSGLSEAGITNTGLKRDEVLNKVYVAFKDPDGIQWEFYMK
jgi:catechol-2,3-dioxygenase